MTQSQFEAALAARLEINKKDAVGILEDIADIAFQELKKGDPVTIRGLGLFKIKDLPARMGRNPQTSEPLKIKASRKLKILPNKALKDRLKVK